MSLVRALGIFTWLSMLNSTAIAADALRQGPSFGSWSTFCSTDPINDIVRCVAMNGDLWAVKNSNGGWSLNVGTGHYPRSDVYLRMGKEPARSTMHPGWSGPTAEHLIGSLRSFESAVVRFTKFGAPGIITNEVSMTGFGDAIDQISKDASAKP